MTIGTLYQQIEPTGAGFTPAGSVKPDGDDWVIWDYEFNRGAGIPETKYSENEED